MKLKGVNPVKKLLLLISLMFATVAPSFGQLTVIDPASIRQQVQQLKVYEDLVDSHYLFGPDVTIGSLCK